MYRKGQMMDETLWVQFHDSSNSSRGSHCPVRLDLFWFALRMQLHEALHHDTTVCRTLDSWTDCWGEWPWEIAQIPVNHISQISSLILATQALLYEQSACKGEFLILCHLFSVFTNTSQVAENEAQRHFKYNYFAFSHSPTLHIDLLNQRIHICPYSFLWAAKNNSDYTSGIYYGSVSYWYSIYWFDAYSSSNACSSSSILFDVPYGLIRNNLQTTTSGLLCIQ